VEVRVKPMTEPNDIADNNPAAAVDAAERAIHGVNDFQPMCSVCAGTGKPLSDKPCICGGRGTQAAEADGLRMELVKLRMGIEKIIAERQDEDSWLVVNALEALLDGCTGVIPGTFIACGEGGNYCSATCRERCLARVAARRTQSAAKEGT